MMPPKSAIIKENEIKAAIKAASTDAEKYAIALAYVTEYRNERLNLYAKQAEKLVIESAE